LFGVGPHLPPAHVVDSGSSTQPLHIPVDASHPKGHAVSDPHWPSPPQVCAVLPLQRVVVGEHTPPQRPVAGSQMFAHVTPDPGSALAPQSVVVCPAPHALVPGTHDPLQRPVAPSHRNGHGLA
jgi:hypothetical protein